MTDPDRPGADPDFHPPWRFPQALLFWALVAFFAIIAGIVGYGIAEMTRDPERVVVTEAEAIRAERDAITPAEALGPDRLSADPRDNCGRSIANRPARLAAGDAQPQALTPSHKEKTQ